MTAPDKTVDVREEDRFDIYAAHNWLASRVDGLDGRPRSCNFPAAHSNFTYLLTYLGRELILHRPPTGSKAASAHDIRRESACKLKLQPVFPYVPAARAFCDDPSVHQRHRSARRPIPAFTMATHNSCSRTSISGSS